MSLLHQDTPEDIDDAALGEEYAKGSGHLILAGIIAAVVVTAVIAIYVFAGQKPPAATGEVEQMWAHPQHTESSGVDANGEAMAKESFDQVFVFALVKLHNQSDQPLFLRNAMVNTTLSDGIHSSYAASAADYDRVYLAYPSMPVPHGKALSLDHHRPWPDGGGNHRFSFSHEQRSMGRGQRPECNLQLQLPAKPGARAQDRCY